MGSHRLGAGQESRPWNATDFTEVTPRTFLRDDFYAWIEDRKMWIWLNFDVMGRISSSAGSRPAWHSGGRWRQAVQFGFEPVAMGRDRAHRRALPFHLVGQFGHAFVGLSQLRTRPTIAATTPLSPSSAMARAGTTIIMPIPIRRATGTSGGRVDVAWLTIRFLMAIGLATQVRMPNSQALAARGGVA